MCLKLVIFAHVLVCLHSCVTVPGTQHCRDLAPEHLSFRYWPTQMYLLGWQMPPRRLQLMSLLGPMETLFLTFFLGATAFGPLSFSVVLFLLTLMSLPAFFPGL